MYIIIKDISKYYTFCYLLYIYDYYFVLKEYISFFNNKNQIEIHILYRLV